MKIARGIALAVAVTTAGCSGGENGEREAIGDVVDTAGVVADAPGQRGTDVDRRLFRETMELADRERLDTLPIGRIMGRVGRSFVGTPYVAGTLEAPYENATPENPGTERLVVNLREMDCVTFVENVLALSRLIRDRSKTEPTFDAFLNELTRIRYRGGKLAGYPSRLHYFSEWIRDNEELGLVRNVTQQIGGVPDREPINFMSTHVESYPALSDTGFVRQIRETEVRLSSAPRYYIPEDEAAEVMDDIQEGDIIAATSTVEGLDIAHTGIAIKRDGRTHLMHAPLVGDSVQISEQTLDRRLLRIEGQDGLMVARPL